MSPTGDEFPPGQHPSHAKMKSHLILQQLTIFPVGHIPSIWLHWQGPLVAVTWYSLNKANTQWNPNSENTISVRHALNWVFLNSLVYKYHLDLTFNDQMGINVLNRWKGKQCPTS